MSRARNRDLSIVIARDGGPKQSDEGKERLLRFSRNDNKEKRKDLAWGNWGLLGLFSGRRNRAMRPLCDHWLVAEGKAEEIILLGCVFT